MEEIWKRFGPNYEVSNLGRVRNIQNGSFLKIETKPNTPATVSIHGKQYTVAELLEKLFSTTTNSVVTDSAATPKKPKRLF